MSWFDRWRGRHEQEGADEPAPELPDNAKRLHLSFTGQVQGVGFRWTSSLVARDLGLTGWVKNEADGSVTAEIQGEESHVGAFFPRLLEEFRSRPIRYVVSEREEIPLVRGERSFEVRY